MTIHMRIMTIDNGPQLVADLPKWPGPVPHAGDYIFHPPFSDNGSQENIAGCVKTVTWRTHDRVITDDRSRFVMTANPYVELYI